MYVSNAIRLFKKWSKRFDYFRTTTGIFMIREKVFIPTIFILINRKFHNNKLPELIKIND
jgi:hypothetical protein